MYRPDQDQPRDPFGGNSPQQQGFGSGMLQNIDLEAVKPWIPKLIAGIVVLAILWFAYGFFFGSIKNVTLTITDTEGKDLDISASLLQNNSEIKSFSGSLTIGLRPGDYQIKLSPEKDYKNPGTVNVTVNEDGSITPETIEVEKNFQVSITSLEFPTQVAVGQKADDVKISFQNNGKQSADIEIVGEGDFEKWNVQMVPEKLTLLANSSMTGILSFEIPSSIKVKNKSSGDELKGKIRIKYLKESKTLNVTLIPTPKISISPNKTFTLKVAAGSGKDEQAFTIKNSSDYDLADGIQVAIENIQSVGNNASNVQKWFSWSLPAPFPTLKQGDSQQVTLAVQTPFTAKPEDISGNIKFFNSVWQAIVPFNLTVEAADVDLSIRLDGSTTRTYNLQKPDTEYEKKTVKLVFQNNGSVPLSAIASTLSCGDEYTKFVDQTDFPFKLDGKGSSNDSKEVLMQISAPLSAAPGESVFCNIQTTYQAPTSFEPIQGPKINVEIIPE